MTYQQGDVLIRTITTIPSDVQIKQDNILAEGEATGHAHRADSTAKLHKTQTNTLYLEAPLGTTITHEEHHAVHLPPGNYQIGLIREYDHFIQQAHTARD